MCPNEGHIWSVHGHLLLLNRFYTVDWQPRKGNEDLITKINFFGERDLVCLPLVWILRVTGDSLDESLMYHSSGEIHTVRYQFPLTFTALRGFLVLVIWCKAKRIRFSYSLSETNLEKGLRQTRSSVHGFVRFHFAHTQSNSCFSDFVAAFLCLNADVFF